MLKEVDILPWLLLPLAGPEDFDEDDMERLPLELQYLEGDKQRETDSDVRRILVEAINQVHNWPVSRGPPFTWDVALLD